MFWFQGDVLMCACPDCSAPMTVRLWLMVADCWRCETSIELTEEQERAAQRVWEQRVRGQQPAAPATQPRTDPTPAGPTAPQQSAVASVTYVPDPSPTTSQPHIRHQPADPPRAAARPRQRVRRTVGLRVSRGLNDLLKNMPAWLISLLFHIVLLTILGLLSSHEDQGPYITLSTRISPVVREGGDTRLVQPSDNSVFDLGVPDALDLNDPALRRAVVRADQDARELRLTDPHNPALPDLNAVRRQHAQRPALAGRAGPACAGRHGASRRGHHVNGSCGRPRSALAGRPSEFGR